MAIAFGRVAAQSDNGTTPIGPLAFTINAGETVVVGVTFNPTSLAVTTVTDNAGGGSSTYTKRGEFVQGSSIKTELWSTDAGAGKAATTVSVAFSGVNSDSGFTVAAYTGVAGIGAFASNGGASGAHTVSITTQDPDNFVVAHFACLDGSTPVADDADSDTLRVADADITVQQGLVDNTAASAGSVTCSLSAPTATPWAAAALELRSTVGAQNQLAWTVG